MSPRSNSGSNSDDSPSESVSIPRPTPVNSVASHFVIPIGLLPRGTKVILWLRVSTYDQKRDGHLKDQEAALRKACTAAGLQIKGVVQGVGPTGSRLISHKRHEAVNLAEFHKAVILAEFHKAVILAEFHKAVILAETHDRFCRSPNYKSEMQIEASDEDWIKILPGFEGHRLAVLIDPDKNSRSAQTIRGITENLACSTREARQQRKIARYNNVLKLKSEGLSNRAVALQIGISASTVGRWLKTPPKGCAKMKVPDDDWK